jgi:hypothetical protein
MNTNKIKLAALILCGIVLSPQTSEAAPAVQLSDRSALFTIDFTFDDPSFAIEIPVATVAPATYADRIDEVGYTIQKRIRAEHNPITDVAGIVLAPQLEINNGRYQVPQGTPTTFTLLIVATFTNPITDHYQAVLTKLPYWLEGRRTTVHQNQLDEIAPSELIINN